MPSKEKVSATYLFLQRQRVIWVIVLVGVGEKAINIGDKLFKVSLDFARLCDN